jgi:hydrogenase nickel incorporation protein HypA/HybF
LKQNWPPQSTLERGDSVHELGMCEGIVEAAVRRANGRQVTSVRVRVGGHPVDAGVVEQGFQLAAFGTVAEGAALDLVMEPMTLRCGGCGHESPVMDHLAMVACPRCNGIDIEVIGDDQVLLESISIAAPAASDVSPRDRLQRRPQT